MRNESNEVKLPSGMKVSDLLKKKGFKSCMDNPNDLEISVSSIEFLKHYLSPNEIDVKIRMVKDGEDCYLPKYIFSHVKHGVVLNSEKAVEDYLKKIAENLNDGNDE